MSLVFVGAFGVWFYGVGVDKEDTVATEGCVLAFLAYGIPEYLGGFFFSSVFMDGDSTVLFDGDDGFVAVRDVD